MSDKKTILQNKKALWNSELTIANRKFTLGGLGDKAIKLKLKSPKGFPNMEVVAFIDWDKISTKNEKKIVEELLNSLQ